MKNTYQHLKTLAIVAALGLGTAGLFAQDNGAPSRPEGGRGPGRMGKPPIIKALDANDDGKIDADELAKASASLTALDKNSDGQLSGDEIHPARPQGGPGGGSGGQGGEGHGNRPKPPGDGASGGPENRGDKGPPPGGDQGGGRPRFVPPVMNALDANKDGSLSADELNGASAALKKLDKNNDGVLTMDEVQGPPPGGRRPGGGGQGGQGGQSGDHPAPPKE